MAEDAEAVLVCRGGRCSADLFRRGSGVTLDQDGYLQGVSVNSGDGLTLVELTASIPNRQVGITTVADIQSAGGRVRTAPTRNNPYHCVLSGIPPEVAEDLFTPTVANPNLET